MREGEALPTGDVRWRLVAETDDEEEATRIMAVAGRRCRESRSRRNGAREAGPA